LHIKEKERELEDIKRVYNGKLQALEVERHEVAVLRAKLENHETLQGNEVYDVNNETLNRSSMSNVMAGRSG
jgi:hypothetical protein